MLSNNVYDIAHLLQRAKKIPIIVRAFNIVHCLLDSLIGCKPAVDVIHMRIMVYVSESSAYEL